MAGVNSREATASMGDPLKPRPATPLDAGQSASSPSISDPRANRITNKGGFTSEYNSLTCFLSSVNDAYVKHLKDLLSIYEEGDELGVSNRRSDVQNPDKKTSSSRQQKKLNKELDSVNLNDYNQAALDYGFYKNLEESQALLINCLNRDEAEETPDEAGTNDETPGEVISTPFDRRLDRVVAENDQTPYGARHIEPGTSALFASEEYIKDLNPEGMTEILEKRKSTKAKADNNELYMGVPSLLNTYALTKLYGSEGGKKLVNRRTDRKWYEVDQTNDNVNGFSSVPTTSSLISWGKGDPHGRTPYHFTDFVYSKYWNKIENNRLITLRRYGAPILDNLKFPGMGGQQDPESGTSSTSIDFPPMASAVTYFGGETGNKLSDLLKFTTGVKWGDVKGEVWEVTGQAAGSESGPAEMFGGISKLAKQLNVATGNFNAEMAMNHGALPPDPYTNGPYENRILGPVNRIDSVKKREAGLEFEWSGLNLVFEYAARPIGGINPKAVLLDIISNFMVIGSASAVFFGGQHRFMIDPASYPFLGGDQGIESWYSGKPLEWAGATITQFTEQGTDLGSMANDSWNKLFGGGSGGSIFGKIKGLFAEGGIASNVAKHKMAARSAGQVPYLQGMKSLLTGEPVGEWHVAIGNPLNPIAMIGNLICNGVEVEFGDELGPDDFPTEVKITVKLDHGMPRDRDAIQSVFNRGMGRIYDLPNNFSGTADQVTFVDSETGDRSTGDTTAKSTQDSGIKGTSDQTGNTTDTVVNSKPKNAGSRSVWHENKFDSISPNSSVIDSNGKGLRSEVKTHPWLAKKSLS